MRCIVALALAALAVLGPIGTAAPCASAAPRMAMVGPAGHACCPRDAGPARLASACCCSIDAPAPSIPAPAPGPAAAQLAVTAPPPVAIAAPARAQVVRAVVAPAAPSSSPPLTLYEHRVALLS